MNTHSHKVSVADAKTALRENAKNKRELMQQIEASKAKLVELCGGKDLREITAINPKRAREVAADMALTQSQLQISQVLLESIDDKGMEHGILVLADSDRMIDEVRRLAEDNLRTVTRIVTAKLKALAEFDEARLPRLVEEAASVRAVRTFNYRFEGLNCGGGEAFSAGPAGGFYYPNWQACYVVQAHDDITAKLAEMQEYSALLRKRLGV